MDRTPWEGLPSALRDAVEQHLGPIVKAEPVREGRRSAFGAIVHLRGADRLFLKGSPQADGTAAAQLDREAALAPHISRLIAPQLLLDLSAEGWRLLGFEYIDGHRASFAPDSPDLDQVKEALVILDQVVVPDDVPLLWFDRRWSHYAPDPRRLAELAGPALLHTDLNAGNLLISASGANLVDWGMASRGASFVNPASLVLSLIASGHRPRDAEAVVTDLDAWTRTDPETIDYYARLMASTWMEAFWDIPHPWTRSLVEAAQRWTLHRRDKHS